MKIISKQAEYQHLISNKTDTFSYVWVIYIIGSIILTRSTSSLIKKFCA